jgi:hypothetical protein
MNSNSIYRDAYTDHVLGIKKSTGSVGVVFDIIKDLRCRHGLSQEFENTEGFIQDETVESWVKIVDMEWTEIAGNHVGRI